MTSLLTSVLNTTIYYLVLLIYVDGSACLVVEAADVLHTVGDQKEGAENVTVASGHAVAAVAHCDEWWVTRGE